MSSEPQLQRVSPATVIGGAIAAVVALAALFTRVGSDAQWLAALGHVIWARHAVPAGIPFAAAPTGHWPNSLVLAELVFGGLESALGDRGLMLAQLLAVAGALTIVARDARSGGAQAAGIAGALLLVALGSIASLAIVRVQLFSLVLFPALLALLRAEARAPSRRIWLALPLLALWSNLHGAALLGLGLLVAHLVLQRARRAPLQAAAVAIAALPAMCLTPALARTPAYYYGLLTNTAAQRGQGMWGPLSVSDPFDLLLVVAVLLLGVRAWRARPPLWELAVAIVLAALTVRADRDGVWLVFLLAAPAARTLSPERFTRSLAPVAIAAGVLLLVVSVARGPVPGGADAGLVHRAIVLADGTPVLADGSIDEQVALAGGHIWAGNPIDAFSRPVQSAYLDWLAASPGAAAATAGVRVVLVTRGSQSQALMARMPGFVAARADRSAILYERTGRGLS
ncbi:MAG: hypothetical protein WBQ18_14420 [Solirubrobacteraceae bacterium]